MKDTSCHRTRTKPLDGTAALFGVIFHDYDAKPYDQQRDDPAGVVPSIDKGVPNRWVRASPTRQPLNVDMPNFG